MVDQTTRLFRHKRNRFRSFIVEGLSVVRTRLKRRTKKLTPTIQSVPDKHELRYLSEHQLKDIGLARDQLYGSETGHSSVLLSGGLHQGLVVNGRLRVTRVPKD